MPGRRPNKALKLARLPGVLVSGRSSDEGRPMPRPHSPLAVQLNARVRRLPGMTSAYPKLEQDDA